MTYCLGWRTQDGVVIIADSLLSAELPDVYQHPEIPYTTFGQLQGNTGGKCLPYVAEEGLKLRVGDSLGAGDLQAAQIVLDILCAAALSLHMDPVSTSPDTDERPPA